MSSSFVPAETLAKLAAMSREQIDTLDFGVVKVDDTGVIQLYNKYEAELAGVTRAAAEGKNFFTQIAACTNNRLFFGRFKQGVAASSLDFTMPYTFTYKLKPTNVHIHLYRDNASKTNWVLVKKR